jgi:hypothetical protein
MENDNVTIEQFDRHNLYWYAMKHNVTMRILIDTVYS